MLAGLAGLGMLAAAAHKRPLELPPLVKWPGGKARLASATVAKFPKHDTYVEPFAGGGAVFFRLPPVKTMVLGDVDEWNIRFFNDVRLGRLKRCRGGFKASRSLFDRSLKKKDACSKLVVASLSYHGDKATYGSARSEGKVMGLTKVGRRADYEEKLKRTHLTIGSFEKTMKRFDKATAVHYLDPPWPLDSGYSETHYAQGKKVKGGRSGGKLSGNRKAFDPEYVMAQASKMKGYVYVVYGDHPSVRAAYAKAKKCGWTIKTEKVDTNKGDGGMEKRVNLIAIKKPGPVKCSALTPRRKKAA
jgi:DNA adenine methylase